MPDEEIVYDLETTQIRETMRSRWRLLVQEGSTKLWETRPGVVFTEEVGPDGRTLSLTRIFPEEKE
ncbi:MAG TPA: hypothetical protein VMW29_00205 [Candidatus Bathyarchaeia archaeon]|nr:hypothetical protein [Candidatus Bathyarchaeia archaeon]